MGRGRNSRRGAKIHSRDGKIEPRHQPVARGLGDDRGGGDRQAGRVAPDHGAAGTGQAGQVAAVDEGEAGGDGEAARPRGVMQSRVAPPDVERVDFRRRGERSPKPPARARRSPRYKAARRRAESFFESSRPSGRSAGSRTTAATQTGPASGPRPTSSIPATGPEPCAISSTSSSKCAAIRERRRGRAHV